MKMYCITIKPQSAFGTPLVGDTLFGQLCWNIANHFGQEKLTQLLADYQTDPFLVLSDAFPHGYLPLPTIPSSFWEKGEEQDRKKLKKKQWIAKSEITNPMKQWQQKALAEKEVMNKATQDQMHNTINRQTNTTGEGQFAPFVNTQIWYADKTELDIYCVLDEQKFTLTEFEQRLEQLGKLGFGRDASTGLGRFEIVKIIAENYPAVNDANAYLTLANTAPQGLDLNKDHSYYQITTRFGRHGDISALTENPFKKPIILAKAGAVFTPNQWQPKLFLGNGLVNVSHQQPNAVHQGYAPVLPLHFDYSCL